MKRRYEIKEDGFGYTLYLYDENGTLIDAGSFPFRDYLIKAWNEVTDDDIAITVKRTPEEVRQFLGELPGKIMELAREAAVSDGEDLVLGEGPAEPPPGRVGGRDE